MQRKITASLISKWHNHNLTQNPTLEQYDDLRYDFGTALPFFVNPSVYKNFPFTVLGEPEIKLTNLSPLQGEAWVLFCYHHAINNKKSMLRTDGFMIPFEWRENTEHSHLIPKTLHNLADRILSSPFLFSSLSLNSQSQSVRWGLHPSFQRFGERIDFSDDELFGENIGSAWGTLAVGLVAARNRYVPSAWPFCSLQFNYLTGSLLSVEGIESKLAVATSYGCREFLVSPSQVTEANHALEELKKLKIPGCENIRIVGSETQPQTIINSILYSKIDWLTETIRDEIKKEKERNSSNSCMNSSNPFKPENIVSGITGGIIALGANEFFSEVMAGEKNDNDDVRNPDFNPSIDDGTDVHGNQPGNFDMTTDYDYDAPKKWGIDSTDIVSPHIQQQYTDTCAIRSQELILRDFGFNVSEGELVRRAAVNGWYRPGSGTPMNHVGNLLEQYGLEVNRFQNANIFTLCSELAQNHKVIIGVDSGELWHRGAWEKIQDFIGFEKADHALLVSGIDTSDPDNIKVILTDPGTGDVAKEYPADQFMDAWKDSGYYMVSTKEPAPSWLPQSAHFDYVAGHLDSFGNWKFDELSNAVIQCQYEITNDAHTSYEVIDRLFEHHEMYGAGSIAPELMHSDHYPIVTNDTKNSSSFHKMLQDDDDDPYDSETTGIPNDDTMDRSLIDRGDHEHTDYNHNETDENECINFEV